MTRYFFILFLTLVSSCGKDNGDNSFTLNTNIGARFAEDKVVVNISSNSTCTNAGITKEELLDIIDDAVNQYWNRVPTSRLTLIKGEEVTLSADFETGPLCTGRISGATCNAGDVPAVANDIVIACNGDAASNFTPGSGILALTQISGVSGIDITGSVILINDTLTSSFDTLSRAEKVSVIAHEIGHAIGIGHAPADEALMYFESYETHSALSRHDVSAITYLYPKKEKVVGVVSCSSIERIDKSDTTGGSSALSLLLPIFFIFLIKRKKIKRSKN